MRAWIILLLFFSGCICGSEPAGPDALDTGSVEEAISSAVSDDGLARLYIPDGALPSGVGAEDIKVTKLGPDEAAIPGARGYRLEPSGTEFKRPLTLTVELDDEGRLPLFYQSSDGVTSPVEYAEYRLGAGDEAMIPIDHFSQILYVSGDASHISVKAEVSDAAVSGQIMGNARVTLADEGAGSQMITGFIDASGPVIPKRVGDSPPSSPFDGAYTIPAEGFRCGGVGAGRLTFNVLIQWDAGRTAKIAASDDFLCKASPKGDGPAEETSTDDLYNGDIQSDKSKSEFTEEDRIGFCKAVGKYRTKASCEASCDLDHALCIKSQVYVDTPDDKHHLALVECHQCYPSCPGKAYQSLDCAGECEADEACELNFDTMCRQCIDKSIPLIKSGAPVCKIQPQALDRNYDIYKCVWALKYLNGTDFRCAHLSPPQPYEPMNLTDGKVTPSLFELLWESGGAKKSTGILTSSRGGGQIHRGPAWTYCGFMESCGCSKEGLFWNVRVNEGERVKVSLARVNDRHIKLYGGKRATTVG